MLGSDLHAVTADDAPLRNMVHVVERAYLSAIRPRARALRQRACRHHRGGAPARRALPRHRCRHNLGWRRSRKAICCRARWCRSAAITRLSTSPRLCQLPFTKLNESKRIMSSLARVAGDDQRRDRVRACRRRGRGYRSSDQGTGPRHRPRPDVASVRRCCRAAGAFECGSLCQAYRADRRGEPAGRVGRVGG